MGQVWPELREYYELMNAFTSMLAFLDDVGMRLFEVRMGKLEVSADDIDIFRRLYARACQNKHIDFSQCRYGCEGTGTIALVNRDRKLKEYACPVHAPSGRLFDPDELQLQVFYVSLNAPVWVHDRVDRRLRAYGIDPDKPLFLLKPEACRSILTIFKTYGYWPDPPRLLKPDWTRYVSFDG